MTITSADGTITTLIGRTMQEDASSSAYRCGAVNASTRWPTQCVIERVDDSTDFAGSPLNTTFMIADHLGSATMEFSSGGRPLAASQFAPFGQEINPRLDSYLVEEAKARSPIELLKRKEQLQRLMKMN